MSVATRALAPVLAVVATACATAPGLPVPHRTRLVIESSKAGVQALVHATVAGEQLTMVLDTGATQSILPAAFVRSHDLRTWPAVTDEQYWDANGNLYTMSTLPAVPVQLDGDAVPVPVDFLVTPVVNAEPILVPQDLLGPGYAIVFDLGREELRYEPEAEALKRLAEAETPLTQLRYSRCADRSHRTVQATVNGVAADMLIDTGATETMLSRNHPVLRSMKSTVGQLSAVTGLASRGPTLIVDQVRIAFGGAEYVLPAAVVPVSSRCGKGTLGADVLSHCTLVWGASSLWVACRPQ